MKNKKKQKIHRDKYGREFIKEAYFVRGKMKFHRIYVIDGIAANEFYEQNATGLDFYLNGDYELMSCNKDFVNHLDEQNNIIFDSNGKEDLKDLPF